MLPSSGEIKWCTEYEKREESGVCLGRSEESGGDGTEETERRVPVRGKGGMGLEKVMLRYLDDDGWMDGLSVIITLGTGRELSPLSGVYCNY